jgi:succinyl-diaminopimelate desuccinylase
LNSFFVPISANTGGPKIALVGHLDTVSTQHDGPPRIEGDRLYGLGASDMKSGVALMIALAECGLPLRADVTLIFYSREEGPYNDNELGPLFEAYPQLKQFDLAIALEPSDNKLQLGCMGSIQAVARFIGKSSHSARPWQGVNAIHAAWPVVKRVAERPIVESFIDDLLYKSSMSVTLASGGRGRNVIPDLCELTVNYRFLPTTTVDEAKLDVVQALAGATEIVFADIAPPAPPHRHHPEVARLQSCGVSVVEPKLAWTDVARFAALGVPAVNFGPGNQAEAHQRNESTSVQQVDEGWAILSRFLVKS